MTSIVTGSIRHILAALVVAALSAAGTNAAPSHGDTPSGSTSTADHAKFEQLNRTFETGPEVTKACLSCHTEAAKQIHTTTHWTWDYINPETGQRLGKMNVVNNFCISAKPNIEQCSSCHVGYGWSKAPYDFTSEENVDCLVCHDTTGEYSRAQLRNPGKRKPKLKKFAQNVGKTSRQTCGTCHFSGGGGKAVKHGDIDPSLNHPDMFIDVHMDADGLNFTCSTCHASDAHAVAGSRYAPDAKDTHGIDVPGRDDRSRASCESCHGLTPHESEDDGDKLNDHTDRVACQTCHIPTYSRGGFASKTWWDWSEAGRMTADGAPLVEHDINGHETYNGKKGSFVWLKDVVPEYVWFNGRVRYTLVGDPVDPSGIVPVNTFEGSPDDPDSRIWPAKVMRGKQPYDTGSQALVAVKTTGKEGYWKTLDWSSAIDTGMRAVNASYSGSFGFVETTMTWPITHMVAPVEDTVRCNECHSPNGRLAALTGFYMPGRDSFDWLTVIGWSIAGLTIIGVLVHAGVRIVAAVTRR